MSASIKSPRIHRLAPVLVDKIAAGEVIEGPHSVLKELIENALDAGATRLRLETKAGGMESILVEDNGIGIHPDDLKASVQRHATSKIVELEDLDEIDTFGFRGEALASIASIAHLEIRSRRAPQLSPDSEGEIHASPESAAEADDGLGARIECRGGELVHTEAVACNPGTTIRVSELFYATPARRKFVKAERTENARNHQAILRLALANPHVRFEYIRDGKEYFNLPPQELPERIAQVYRSQIGKHLVEVEGETNGLRLHGFLTDEGFFRANRDGQYQYINNRYVEIKNFSYFVKKAYGELLPPGSHPYFFLFLEIDPRRVDVNVHPAKREVRLLDESLLHSLIVNAVSKVLRPHTPLKFGRYASDAFASTHAPHNRPANANQLFGGAARLIHDQNTLLEQPEKTRPVFEIDSSDIASRRAAYEAADGASGPGAAAGNGSQGAASAAAGGNSAFTGGAPTAGNDENSPELRHEFLPRRHFGVLYGTYILAEGDDGLYIIDQHTAHERINYEKMRRKLEAMRGQRQALLHPIPVDCLPDELTAVLGAREELLESGFLIEEFGPSSYIVREIPPYLEPGSETELVLHLIHRVLEGEEQVRLYDEYAAMRACKASIKRNDHVSGEVLSEILKELAACENPSRCPHGRPTMLRISPAELDRMFHRS
ncbi:MAG: DNA mismatch repair endonuclease MutL [bacterium]|nr:DNA mismatch repair endonuclease MutL [bacterium]